MKKINSIFIWIFLVFFISNNIYAQTRIQADQACINCDTVTVSSVLEVQSTDKGVLIPRMTSIERNNIVSPANGLLVYDTSTASFWYYSTDMWTELSPNNPNEIADLDNDTKVQTQKTIDDDIIHFDIAGETRWRMVDNRLEPENDGKSIFIGPGAGAFQTASDLYSIGIGWNTLNNNDSGVNNVAIGYQAMEENESGNNNLAIGTNALRFNTRGDENVAIGFHALESNILGESNTAVGQDALQANTSGNRNTATGYFALSSNTSGNNNTAIGGSALQSNTEGNNNTANGYQALFNNSFGSSNTGVGALALRQNTIGQSNTALGYNSLYSNIDGDENTAVGAEALYHNTGNQNTAMGYHALYNNISGDYNTANGYAALESNTTGSNNTAVGRTALQNNTTGSNRTAIGRSANSLGTDYDNSTGLGFNADCTAGNQVRIGNMSVTSIGGYAAWSNLSDQRFKQNIKEDVVGLEFINKLRPVTYTIDQKSIEAFISKNYGEEDKTNWPSKYDASKMVRTGFLAQEVEAAAQEVGFDFSGVDKPKNDKDFYGLRYATFTVPLVKAVQELHVIDEESNEQIALLEAENERLQNELEVLSEMLDELQIMVNEKAKSEENSKVSIKTTELELKNPKEEQIAYIQQNEPNPFEDQTTISYFLPEQFEKAEIHFVNVNGQVLKSITLQDAGIGQLQLSTQDLQAGIYSYTLIVDGKRIDSKRMVLIRE